MPIKPIDMQVLLPNIRKAAKPENVKNSRNETAMQQNQIKGKAEVETKKNKVANLKKKDKNEIKNDQKNKKGSGLKNKKEKQKDNEEKKDEEQVVVDNNHGSKFDIKV